MNSRRIIILSIIVFPLLLGGCGVKLEPTVVLARMAESMSQVKQVVIEGQLKLSGNSDTAIFNSLQTLSAVFTGRVDINDPGALRYLIQLDLSGQGAEGSTKIGAEIRGLPDYTYFQVQEAKVPSSLPVSLTPDKRWYKVKNPEEGPAGGNILGGGNRLTNAEGLQLRSLINNSRLFTAQTVLADETIKGVRTNHFAAMIDKTALANLLDGVQTATNGKIKPNREAALKLATDYTYDLWISRSDHRLIKLVAQGNLSPVGQSESMIELNFSRFDSPVSVAAPSEVKEFTLESLLKSPLGQL